MNRKEFIRTSALAGSGMALMGSSNPQVAKRSNKVLNAYYFRAIKEGFPDRKIAMFIYASKSDMVVEKCATISGLDAFGCDGRPWGKIDGGKLESEGKVLLDGVGQRFIDAARKNNKQSLWLIENHNMADADIPILEKRLPEVVKSDVDHLIYYYNPRNLSQPDKIMSIVRKNLKQF